MSQDRDNKGRFATGNTAAKGRPQLKQDIIQYIMSQTNDLKVVVDEAIAMLQDESCPRREKIQIIHYLTDRAIGKAAQYIDTNKQIRIELKLPEGLEDSMMGYAVQQVATVDEDVRLLT